MTDPSRTEAQRLADQLRRACEGHAWHGPAVFELLDDVPADQAAAHPVPGAHSIWEIVLHLKAWQDVARTRLNGDAVRLSDAEDWPAVPDPSDAAWQAARTALTESYQALHAAIAQSLDDRLEDQAPGTDYSLYVLLHGVVQHNLYHAGQIALLKKA